MRNGDNGYCPSGKISADCVIVQDYARLEISVTLEVRIAVILTVLSTTLKLNSTGLNIVVGLAIALVLSVIPSFYDCVFVQDYAI
jgi:hypothetical protein